MTISLRDSDLRQFTGSATWFRHSFNRAVIYTEGIQLLMERGEAYWLIDAIASQIGSPIYRKAAAIDGRIDLLHFWKLVVKPDHSATLVAIPDSGEPAFIRQDIPYTNLAVEQVDVWAQANGQGFTLMLPGEY